MDLTCGEEMMEESPIMDETLRAPKEETMLVDQNEMPQAFIDPALVNDSRVLQNMLKVEERLHNHTFCYFKMLQTDISPAMRTSVTTWMYEVCAEECLPDNVFLLAVTYMDRFLTVNKIERSQFQLLAAACLLISSKWVGTVMGLDRLIFYTANSIERQMLLNWEMLVLAQFKWDTFSLTPHDFVEQILHRLPDNLWSATNVKEKVKTYVSYCATGGNQGLVLEEILKKTTRTFITLYRIGVSVCFECGLMSYGTDHNFRIHLPSMIASASIAAAIGTQVSGETLQEVLHCLHVITNIETDVLRSTMDQIKLAIQIAAQEENREDPGGDHPGISDASGLDKLGELGQAETPTDVGDIEF